MDAMESLATESRRRHAAQAAKPIVVRGAPPLPMRYCGECGNPYWPTRQDQDFCGTACRQNFHKRRYQRGAELYDFAMDWRGKRRKGGFTEFCRIVDEWLRDERDRRARHAKIREAHQRQMKGGQ